MGSGKSISGANLEGLSVSGDYGTRQGGATHAKWSTTNAYMGLL